MPSIEIDGKKVSFEGKKMILQVAQDNGIEIPAYCYHPGLSIVASCRICLGEIESPDPKDPTKMVRVPKLVPTCQTPAGDGMRVFTKSEKSKANQKAVMEFLLINHPLDCPVCDQAGECYLQDYSYKYGRSESRFIEDKSKNPKKDVGEHVLLYADRCIMCTRCVRFTREVTGTNELAVFGRGHKEEIDVFPGRPVNNELSANVIDLCPVGALLDKDFLFTQRVWFLKSTPSISPLTSGGENIEIHHSGGRIYRIKPRYNKDVNKWWITDETRYAFQYVHSADRLRAPLKMELEEEAEMTWEAGYAQLEDTMRRTFAKNGKGSTAVVVSSFDATEEIYLQMKFVRSIDPGAWLVVGAVKVAGENKVFKNPLTKAVTFTIQAEKAPNRKGAEKMAKFFGGNVCSVEELAGKGVKAVVMASDPVVDGGTAVGVVAGVETVIWLGMTGPAGGKAALVLPTVSWAEKGGVYENFEGRIQAFGQAIPPLEDCRSTGQIFWDLLGYSGQYSALTVRRVLGTSGLTEYEGVDEPTGTVKVEDMEYAVL